VRSSSADSQVRLRGAKRRSLLGGLWSSSGRLFALLARDLKARYAGSAIGSGWNLLRPLLQVGAYYFAFGIVLAARQGREIGDSEYPLYLLSGLVPWLCYLESATKGSGSLVRGAGLIKKVRLPLEVLTAKEVLAPAVTYGPFVLLLWLLSGAAAVSPASVLVLVPWFAAQVMFTWYLVHAVAILTAVLRDIGQAFNVLVAMTIFVSPVLFPFELVPPAFQPILYANPMTPFVEGYHRLVLSGSLPHANDALLAGAWLTAAWLLARVLHGRAHGRLVDWL
jgi:lipopolysaccharide transport system permease protein